MTFRHFLIVMSLATLAVWAAWVYVLATIDPTAAGAPGFVFFYLTFALALVGTLTILGTAVRRLLKRHEVVSRQVSVSFRQSVVLSALLIASLALLGSDLLNAWNIILLVLMASVIELAFLAARRPRPIFER
jgi:hypothetical protein